MVKQEKKVGLFDPKIKDEGKNRAAPVRSIFSDALPVYTIPKGSSQDDILKILILFMLSFTSEHGRLDSWKSLIISYTLALFPGVGEQLSTTQYNRIPLSAEEVTSCV